MRKETSPVRQVTFPTQLLVPVCIVMLLLVTVFTGTRKTRDDHGRPIVVYAHPPCPPDLMVHFERAFEDFRHAYPHIELKVLHITANYEDKLRIMVAGKVAPDVVLTNPLRLPVWVDLNALLPLDSLMASDGEVGKDDYFPAAIDTFTWRGQLYALPKDATTDVLIYNREMFRRHNVPFPTPEWTWDDFLAAAKLLTHDTDGDGRADVFGAAQPAWDRMVIQNGGKVISDDGTRCLLGEPEAVAALKSWAGLVTEHRVTPTPESMMDSTVWRLFAMERLGMFVSMYPAVAILRRTCDFEWDIALPPQGREGRQLPYQGGGFSILRQTKHPDAAYTFARWMTSQGMRHTMTFDIPCYVKLGSSDEWQDPEKPPLNKHVAIDAMAYAGSPAIKHPENAQINDAIGPHLDRLIRGVCTVEEAVAAAVPEVNEILERYIEGTDRK